MKHKIFFVIFILFFVGFVNAGYGYDDPNLPKLNTPPQKVITFNNNTGSVNNSIFWDSNAFSDTRWLNIDGSNADQTIDIGSEDFTTDGKVIAATVEKDGTTSILDVQPDAVGDGSSVGSFRSGFGLKFFKNADNYVDHNDAANENPVMAFYGGSSIGQVYGTVGVDDFGRMVFGGTTSQTVFDNSLTVAGNELIFANVNTGYIYNANTASGAGHRHITFGGKFDANDDPVWVMTDRLRQAANFGVDSAIPQLWLHDGSTTYTNVLKLYHDGVNGVLETISGWLNISSNVFIEGDLNLTGDLNLNGSVKGDLNLTGNLDVNGSVNITGANLTVSGITHLAGNLTVGSSISSATKTITESADNTDVSTVNTLYISAHTPETPIVIGGLKGGVDGQVLYVSIINHESPVTLEHQEGTLGNQNIIMHDSLDETLSNFGGWTLICNGIKWYDVRNTRDEAVYIQASDLKDQEFKTANEKQPINITTTDESNGLSIAISNVTVSREGVYSIFAQPQVTAAAGQSGVFHMWLEMFNKSDGWMNVSNSNVELSLSSQEEDVIPLILTLKLNATEKVRVMGSVSDTDITLDAQLLTTEPFIPSIIFTMYRIGS